METPTLRRDLGLFAVFSIAAGAMISSGLFVLPGIAFTRAGPATVLSYALAGLLIVPAMLSQAELATAMPKAGGAYFFVERSLGPMAGTVAGLADWLSLALKTSFALVGIGALAQLAWPFPGGDAWGIRFYATLALLLFVTINIVGTRHSGRLQTFMVVFLLTILVLHVALGVPHVEVKRFDPFLPKVGPLGEILTVAGMVFVSYGGLTKVVTMSEEVRNPTRNLPLGMFLAFVVVNLLYVGVVFVVIGTVPANQLAGSNVPVYLSAVRAIGPWAGALVTGGALLAFATTANGGLLASARSPMAMSRDGLLPERLAATSSRFGTPVAAIILTTIVILATFLLSLENLVKTASTMMILMFAMVNVAVIIMRTSGLENYRPTVRVPLFPWLNILAIVVYAVLIARMGKLPLILSACFALGAVLWYILYVGRQLERESAFIFMVRKIMASDILQRGLEDELKQITIERDSIALDRFDHLIQDAKVLDLTASINAKEFFARVSKELAPRLHADEQTLLEKFLARERESSTVLKPGLAVPHVVVSGEQIFDLMLVRCKPGIVFSELTDPVHIAFVLVGSLDERNFHLKALMHIAHIIGEDDFEERWMRARGRQELRDVLLLSHRERQH